MTPAQRQRLYEIYKDFAMPAENPDDTDPMVDLTVHYSVGKPEKIQIPKSMADDFVRLGIATPPGATHDPIDRALPGEPRLSLMARDVLSPGFDRLYAIIRESGPEHKAAARQLLERIFLTNDSRPKNPGKDREHAWSARRIADESEAFYNKYIRGEPPRHRVQADEHVPNVSTPTMSSRDIKPLEIGDEIILNAPVHFARPGDPSGPGQIISGSVGTIRDIDVDGKFYIVAFDGYIDANYPVPFDRADVVDV